MRKINNKNSKVWINAPGLMKIIRIKIKFFLKIKTFRKKIVLKIILELI